MVRVPSPPQIRSQVVVCVSTPRMYPRSGYFLVIGYLEVWNKCDDSYLILIIIPFRPRWEHYHQFQSDMGQSLMTGYPWGNHFPSFAKYPSIHSNKLTNKPPVAFWMSMHFMSRSKFIFYARNEEVKSY